MNQACNLNSKLSNNQAWTKMPFPFTTQFEVFCISNWKSQKVTLVENAWNSELNYWILSACFSSCKHYWEANLIRNGRMEFAAYLYVVACLNSLDWVLLLSWVPTSSTAVLSYCGDRIYLGGLNKESYKYMARIYISSWLNQGGKVFPAAQINQAVTYVGQH